LAKKKNIKPKKQKGDFYFDEAAADHAVGFIEKLCTHVKGELAGEQLKLEDWQKEKVIRPLFGWKRNDGTRKYRYCWLEIPRKNGKTSIAAPVALYSLFGDSEPGAEVYFAAASREQASIAFDIATQMIRQNKTLTKNSEIYKNSVVLKDSASFYKVLSAEAYSKHGLNAHTIIFDEIHAQPDRELWDVLTTSIGSRRQPLIMAITTAGIMKKGHIAYEMHKYAKNISKGLVKDEQFLSVIYQADSTDDPFSEETWKKCNPNYGISLKKSYLEDEARKAKSQPTYLNTFKRLHLNIWTSSDKQFISEYNWKTCNLEPLPDEFFYGKKCVLAFDLSATSDFTALAIGTKDAEGISHIKVYNFFPEKRVDLRAMKDQIQEWIEGGEIISVPGISLNYEFVFTLINKLQDACDIVNILYDRWNKNWLVNKLEEEEAPIQEFGQGFKSMSPATKEFEKAVMDKKVNHGGAPVLAWMNSNMAITEDPAGNIKPNKQKSSEKIDGMIAAIMCFAGLQEMKQDSGKSVYDDRGFLTL